MTGFSPMDELDELPFVGNVQWDLDDENLVERYHTFWTWPMLVDCDLPMPTILGGINHVVLSSHNTPVQ